MTRYIIKRLISLVPTIFLVAVMVFLLIHLIPGDPALVMLGADAGEQDLASVRESLGLNEPLLTQFYLWMKNLAAGNLGVSIHSRIPVVESVRERFPVTLGLTTLAMIFSIVLAIPSGVLAAVHHNSGKDYLFMGATILGVSIPGFWLVFWPCWSSASTWAGSRPPGMCPSARIFSRDCVICSCRP